MTFDETFLNTKYPLVFMDDIATLVKRPADLSEITIAHSLGVKWYGKGTYVHEIKPVHQLKANRFVVRSNDLIYNDMWARNGSVAIVPEEFDGFIASAHFPTWELDLKRVFPSFLGWYFQTPVFWSDCETKSQGSTGRNAITKALFRRLVLPLPPLDEQRRIVAEIEALAERIETARGLRHGALEEAKAFVASMSTQIFTQFSEDDWTQVGNICDVRGGIQKSRDRIPNKNPIRYLTVAHVQRNWIDFGDVRYFEVSNEELEKWRLLQGDVLVVEGNGSEDQIGRSALFNGDIEDCVHQNHIIRVRPDAKCLSSRYLNHYFNSPVGMDFMKDISRTSSGLYHLSVGKIRSIDIPIPDVDMQNEIVEYLDDLQANVDHLKDLQTQTQAELDALLPSILDKAFKGEL